MPARSVLRVSRSIEQIAGREAGRLGRAGRASNERLDARNQLGEGERLGQVVIATRLQAADAVVHGPPRAQDQHGRPHAAGAHPIDERETVELRQHHVDDGDVVSTLDGKVQAPFAVGRRVHRKPGLREPLAHEVGNRRVVFDDEHPHRAATAC